jgi:hypothetical protein
MPALNLDDVAEQLAIDANKVKHWLTRFELT